MADVVAAEAPNPNPSARRKEIPEPSNSFYDYEHGI